jgi:hypothetical protein
VETLVTGGYVTNKEIYIIKRPLRRIASSIASIASVGSVSSIVSVNSVVT